MSDEDVNHVAGQSHDRADTDSTTMTSSLTDSTAKATATVTAAEESEDRINKPLPTPSSSVAEAPSSSSSSSSSSSITPVSVKPASGPATVDHPPPAPPSVYKRKSRKPPRGILKPAPPPTKAFSFRRDILQQLNTRLAQQGVNVQVPVPQGSLAGTAQGTAQAASNLLGGMLRRVSGFASGAGQVPEDASSLQHNRNATTSAAAHANGNPNPSAARSHVPNPINVSQQRSASTSVTPSASRALGQQPQRTASLSSTSSDATLVGSSAPSTTSSPPVHATPTNNLPQPSSSARPLRKVRFTVSNMAVTYPISGAISPGEEDATRRRIETEHRLKLKEQREKKWSVAELERLYRDCCRMREELPLRKMRQVFQEASLASPPILKTIDLSFVPLDRQAIEPVSDLLSVDFGLQKLVLENCGLTDEGVKSILHALLVSGSLSSLSLASNKRIKYHGWRYIGIYMRRARALKYLDLSENIINRASVEHILGALNKRVNHTVQQAQSEEGKQGKEMAAQEAQDDDDEEPLTIQAKLLAETVTVEVANLTSLRMENCGLKTPSLELLAQAVRYSDLSHLSLRRNRINHFGAVALAVMLKDYHDSQIATVEEATPVIPNGEHHPSSHAEPRQGQGLSHTDGPPRGRNVHSGQDSLQAQPTNARSASPGLPSIPFVISSPGGGVTRRTLPTEAIAALQEASNTNIVSDPSQEGGATDLHHNGGSTHKTNGQEQDEAQTAQMEMERRQSQEASLALYHAQRAKRILQSVPRMGNLLTLDLKSNDIRGGVVYLSHALKKNRTLKVLNLSDNNIEVMGLVAIADALKYNSTLETLDMSHNPCSGPALDGITTLRNAFTLNSNLKRLFLSDTELSSEGAIALAEFLPEARSLIHLDLTENLQIDIAGVMAMAVSVKMNKSLRCLDLNIPPNAPDFARLSQDILNSCIRNTELAQRRAQQKGVKAPIAAPIYRSTLARAAKEKEESDRLHSANKHLEHQANGRALSPTHAGSNQRGANISLTTATSGKAQVDRRESAMQITDAANECIQVLRELWDREQVQEKDRKRDREIVRRPDGSVAPPPMGELARDLMVQSDRLRDKLQKALGVMQEGELLERALQVNDDLEAISTQLRRFYAGQMSDYVGANAIADTAPAAGSFNVNTSSSPHLAVPGQDEDGLSSPNFSIGSSDDDDDDEIAGSTSHAAMDPSAHVSTTDSLTSTAVSALAGLGIDTSDEQQTAAREAPSETLTQQIDPETELTNQRAKGQLSEEGEIFRRARSLSIGDDDDDEEEENAESAAKGISERKSSAPSPSNTSPTNVKLSPFAASKIRKDLEFADENANSGTSATGDAVVEDSAVSATSAEDLKDVSGEELRKELLETNVPRRNSHSSVYSESDQQQQQQQQSSSAALPSSDEANVSNS